MSGPWKASVAWTEHNHDFVVSEYFDSEADAWRWVDAIPPHVDQSVSVIWNTVSHAGSKPRTELAPPDPRKAAQVQALRSVLADVTNRPSKGAVGHWHGGPDKCPVCGGIAPNPKGKP